MGDPHFALLLAPLLIVELYYAQILELQLLLLAATARLLLLLAVLLVVGVEVVLLVFGKRIALACVVDVEIAQFEHRSTERGNLGESALRKLWHLELLL